MSLDARLQEMLDHYEIGKLLNSYCHGCDRGDQLMMASVYSEDGWDDHGHNSGNGADFSRTIMEAYRDIRCLSHLQGQTLINVDGEQAGAETYFLAIMSTVNDGKEIVSQLGGRYVDRLVREKGAWKIKLRTCLRDWSISLPADMDLISMSGLKQGTVDEQDPSWAALGLTHSRVPGFPERRA